MTLTNDEISIQRTHSLPDVSCKYPPGMPWWKHNTKSSTTFTCRPTGLYNKIC